MTSTRTRRNLYLFGLILGFALSCAGQTSTSLLSGTIFDNSGAVVTGAIVTATNEATGTTLRQLTNNSGLYAFPSIPSGAYTIEVEAPGFKKARQTGNTLAVGTPLTVNITLELGSSTEVVKVEASVEQINTTNATLGDVIERQTVTALPLNGRNPLNLIVLEPGVTHRSGTGIDVNGLRASIRIM